MTTAEIKTALADLDAAQKETQRYLAANRTRLDEIGEMVGGLSANNGYFMEEVFLRALELNPVIGDMRFNGAAPYVRGLLPGGRRREYDCVLENDEYVAIVEVKYRLHPDDVVKFVEKAIPEFRIFFPQFGNRKIIGAVGAGSFSEPSVIKAQEYGLAILSTVGRELRQIAPATKEY